MTWYDVKQNSPEWFERRLGKITASQFGTVMAESCGGISKGAQEYALKIALERIKGTSSVDQISTFHMKRGHEQEPIARKIYEQTFLYEVTNGGFFDYGFYGDSPDGLISINGVLEIKSVIAPVQHATLKKGSYDSKYHWQIVGHLDCSNRDWCDYVSFCADFPEGKQILVYRVYREQVLKDIEILREKRFAFNNLVDNYVNDINSILY